jgi:hypothetical protein
MAPLHLFNEARSCRFASLEAAAEDGDVVGKLTATGIEDFDGVEQFLVQLF